MSETVNLSAIEARAAAASPGPWVVHTSGGSWDIYEGVPVTTLILSAHRHEQDATFVAHARADIPALVGEVQRLEAALAAMRDAVDAAWSLVLSAECKRADKDEILAALDAAKEEGK
jgi:hypothetical protein